LLGYSLLSNKAESEGKVNLIVNDSGNEQHYVLENNIVKATFNSTGKLISLLDKRSQHESIEPNSLANQFVIFEDIPMYWDAWDVDVYHLEKRKNVENGTVRVLEKGPLRASIEVQIKISNTSTLTQVISLNSFSPRLDFDCEVDWDESHKFLKVEFPFNIRNLHATYEIQYGYIQRPTHWNTSWDVAKFEVCAQKWADFSENGFGVSIINDCKFGYATHGNIMRLSLLRSAKNPDPEADIGHHKFKYALFPHQGTFQQSNVVRESFNFNVPLLVGNLPNNSNNSSNERSFFSVNHDSIIIDAVKKAEDSNNVVVRMYESLGGRGIATLKSILPFKTAHFSNLLEEQLSNTNDSNSSPIQWKDGQVSFAFKPFQIITLVLSC